ncbi:hypothetical protein DV711_09555 [Motiliproteus coralliicola]|uniref:Uncharacterized protein n=1 Tax=Motiliproteus coralliicola TaxID=2283196 RepID=A0A369WL54_9GAMM|nr:hypothetical protein DV711_09555 [Motiliproteus coralliicola]
MVGTLVYLVEIQKPELTQAQKAELDQLILSEAAIKSHVWNHSNLSIGIIKEQIADRNAFARSLCEKFDATGARGVAIDVVDVLKLQKSGGEDWDVIGYARCRVK